MTFAARCSCGTVVSKVKPLTSTKSSLFTASMSTLANSEIGIRFFNHNRPLLSMYMKCSDCPMRKHKQPPFLSAKVMAVNLSSYFGPSWPEVNKGCSDSGFPLPLCRKYRKHSEALKPHALYRPG